MKRVIVVIFALVILGGCSRPEGGGILEQVGEEVDARQEIRETVEAEVRATVQAEEQATAETEQKNNTFQNFLVERPTPQGENFQGADLSGTNMSREFHEWADFQGADLVDADLSFGSFTGANFEGADLSGANLEGASLISATLRLANLEGANLAGANLINTNFTGANLRNATIKDLYGAFSNFSYADLRGADLSGVDFRSALFRYADLSGVDMQNSLLSGGIFVGANLSGANLSGSQIVNNVNFWEANLSNASLRNVELVSTDFIETRLDGTDFTNSNLWEGTNDLYSVDLTKAILPDRAQVSQMSFYYNDDTLFPEGFSLNRSERPPFWTSYDVVTLEEEYKVDILYLSENLYSRCQHAFCVIYKVLDAPDKLVMEVFSWLPDEAQQELRKYLPSSKEWWVEVEKQATTKAEALASQATKVAEERLKETEEASIRATDEAEERATVEAWEAEIAQKRPTGEAQLDKLPGLFHYNEDLSNSDLEGSFLFGSQLQGANLSNVNLKNSVLFLPSFWGANLSNATFEGSCMASVYFIEADLRGADFTNTFLDGVFFLSSDLANANFERATFSRRCYINAETVLPEKYAELLREKCWFDETFTSDEFIENRLNNIEEETDPEKQLRYFVDHAFGLPVEARERVPQELVEKANELIIDFQKDYIRRVGSVNPEVCRR